MAGSGDVQPPSRILKQVIGEFVMLVQRLGIVFAIFLAFALGFGSFVNYAKSSRLAHPDVHGNLVYRQG
ncbi:MAG: hypothetical protein AAAB35_11130 [Phyllobacterium sp.]|uniref:hypothetical protein n=1 Tax=Phyllobacterium sp. TaxID=1871046 RepID=UPI0030F1EE2A